VGECVTAGLKLLTNRWAFVAASISEDPPVMRMNACNLRMCRRGYLAALYTTSPALTLTRNAALSRAADPGNNFT